MNTSTAPLATKLADLRRALRSSVVFMIWFTLFDLFLFAPAVAASLNFVARSSGDPAISNYDLTAFFLSTRGLVFLGVAGVTKLALLFTQMGGLTLIALATLGGRVTTAGTVLWQSLSCLGRFARLGLVQLAIGAGLWLPFLLAALAVKHVHLGGADINYYLAMRPPEYWRAVVWVVALGTTGAAVHLMLLTRWMLAIPVVLVEGQRPVQAMRASWSRTRGRWLTVLLRLGSWWAVVWSVFAVAAWLIHHPVEWMVQWAGLDLRRLVPVILASIMGGAATTLAWACLALNGHQWLITRFYLDSCPEPMRKAPLSAHAPSPGWSFHWGRIAAWTVLALGAGWAALTVVLSLNRMPEDDQIEITAHRGSSRKAPENTLAAIRQAIADGADYAEIDVQRTRDGHVVVLHDGDLLRLAKDPRRIETLTLAEVRQLDVGTWFGEAFRGERIPTLEEAIELSRDRIRLNIELKYNRPDSDLAFSVVMMLRRLEFTNRCVITSLDYGALRNIEAMAPELPTGLIVTAVVGDVTRTEADFLSLNSARATSSLVSLAHRRGKEVHVWTVNNERGMMEMIERGVDNIITDEPAMLAALRRSRGDLAPAERLALRLRTLWLPSAPLPESSEQTPQ